MLGVDLTAALVGVLRKGENTSIIGRGTTAMSVSNKCAVSSSNSPNSKRARSQSPEDIIFYLNGLWETLAKLTPLLRQDQRDRAYLEKHDES